MVTSSSGPAAPNGFAVVGVGGAPRYWDVTTSAVFTGSVQVCVQYDATQVSGDESALQMVDATNSFANITTSVNTTTKVVCGTTTTLSTFAIVDQSL